jgi:hypothetical protein
MIRNFSQKQDILDLVSDVQLLQDQEEIAILEACSNTLRQMKKDAETAENWMGKTSEESKKMSRSFIDRLTSLTDLCSYKGNRVLDFGKNEDDKKENDSGEQYEFLNLSEFDEAWDAEDQKICKDDEVVDE